MVHRLEISLHIGKLNREEIDVLEDIIGSCTNDWDRDKDKIIYIYEYDDYSKMQKHIERLPFHNLIGYSEEESVEYC